MTFIEGNTVLDLPPKLKEHFLLMTTHEVLRLVFLLGQSESKTFLKFSYDENCVEVDLFNSSLDMGEWLFKNFNHYNSAKYFGIY